jgi:hypothetical protein
MKDYIGQLDSMLDEHLEFESEEKITVLLARFRLAYYNGTVFSNIERLDFKNASLG